MSHCPGQKLRRPFSWALVLTRVQGLCPRRDAGWFDPTPRCRHLIPVLASLPPVEKLSDPPGPGGHPGPGVLAQVWAGVCPLSN